MEAIKRLFGLGKTTQDEIMKELDEQDPITKHYAEKSLRNLKEKEEAEKANRIEAARAKLNEHLQRSAARGRHDYQAPEEPKEFILDHLSSMARKYDPVFADIKPLYSGHQADQDLNFTLDSDVVGTSND